MSFPGVLTDLEAKHVEIANFFREFGNDYGHYGAHERKERRETPESWPTERHYLWQNPAVNVLGEQTSVVCSSLHGTFRKLLPTSTTYTREHLVSTVVAFGIGSGSSEGHSHCKEILGQHQKEGKRLAKTEPKFQWYGFELSLAWTRAHEVRNRRRARRG